MSISYFLRDFLLELQRLYNQLALILLHKRMGRYHRRTNQCKNLPAKDFRSSLLEYLDNVVVVEKDKNTVSPEIYNPVHAAASEHTSQSQHVTYPFNFEKKHVKSNPYKLNKRQVGELSRYFKTRKKGTELHPGIEEKLKGSLWNHINASIQCALKGDSHNAKMHVDIANYAIKEIAHYMPEGKYMELTKKINKRLDTLSAEQ